MESDAIDLDNKKALPQLAQSSHRLEESTHYFEDHFSACILRGIDDHDSAKVPWWISSDVAEVAVPRDDREPIRSGVNRNLVVRRRSEADRSHVGCFEPR